MNQKNNLLGGYSTNEKLQYKLYIITINDKLYKIKFYI